jgi:hypothetical protein
MDEVIASAMLRHDGIQPQLSGEVSGQRWYAVTGTRMYTIATLAGQFPDVGAHQPDEMGGVWAPPIKLLDGYWLGLRAESGPIDRLQWLGHRAAEQPIHWLSSAATWQIAPDGVTLGYRSPALGLQVHRREWIVPDESVLVVDVMLSRMDGASWHKPLGIECGVYVRSDLHGVWLSEERLGWADGADRATYDADLATAIISDTLHPWTVCVGASEVPINQELGEAVWGPERTTGRGTGVALWYRRRIDPARPAQLRFLIAGASAGREQARDLFARYAHPAVRSASVASRPAPTSTDGGASVDDPLERAARAASDRFRAPFAQCILRSPDRALDEVFAWAKADAASLTLEVPGLGRAAMAGLPEFAWWFGADLAFGVLPLLPAGQTSDAKASLRTLAAMSRKHGTDGLVPHEVITNGVVFHAGNPVETPLFVRALYHTYRWTGDRMLLEELFPFCLRGMEQWLLETYLEPGEQIPAGSSIVETPEMGDGLQALDVAAYLVEALDLLGVLAGELGQDDVAQRLRERATSARSHVQAVWWLPAERLFGDVRASRRELEELLVRISAHPAPDDSLTSGVERLRRALAEDADSQASPTTRRPWLLLHMVQALAADAGLPTREQATALLDRLETAEWTERYGIVLNAASDRRVMTLPTGALAVGEARYGRADRALDNIRRIAATFGAAMPGALSEFSPDGGCFLQLWSTYGVVWPVVHYFFGLRPDVAARRLVCVPQLPADWPQAELRAVPLGGTQLNVMVETAPDGVRVVVEIADPAWEVTLGVVVSEGVGIASAAFNASSDAPSQGTTEEGESNVEHVTMRFARLSEPEGRATWLAPARRGASRYELCVSWSIGQVGRVAATEAPGERTRSHQAEQADG